MATSEKTIDNTIGYRRKLRIIAVVSGLFTCLLTLVLIGVNYKLADLNKNYLSELSQLKSQNKNNIETAANIKDELDASQTELNNLKNQIIAQKKVNKSLQEKLSATLKLVAEKTAALSKAAGENQKEPDTTIASPSMGEELQNVQLSPTLGKTIADPPPQAVSETLPVKDQGNKNYSKPESPTKTVVFSEPKVSESISEGSNDQNAPGTSTTQSVNQSSFSENKQPQSESSTDSSAPSINEETVELNQ